GLKRVVRADEVHPHRAYRALDHRVDTRDRSRVHEMRRTVDDAGQELVVEDVSIDEREVRMLRKARPAERVPVEIVDRDDLVVVDEPAGERRANEARAARDHDALSAQSHAASLRLPALVGRDETTKTTVTTAVTLASAQPSPRGHPR